jgi:hypothetical protein
MSFMRGLEPRFAALYNTLCVRGMVPYPRHGSKVLTLSFYSFLVMSSMDVLNALLSDRHCNLQIIGSIMLAEAVWQNLA